MKKVSGWIVGLLLIWFLPLPTYALETVTLQLKWSHQFQFAGYYMAKAKGYYEQVGLNVNFIEGGRSVSTVEEVLANNANFGVGSSSLLLARSQGKPVVALGVIFQHSSYVVLMRKTSPTQSIHDIEGKRFTLESQADELLAYIKKEGVPLDKIKVIHLNPEIQDLISGRTDAMSAHSTDAQQALDNLSIPYAIYSPRSAGIDFYGDNFFTTEAEIALYPERVKAFREASIKGWQYAMTHVDETIDLIREEYAPYRTRAHLEYEAQAMKALILPNVTETGYMFEGRWRHIAQTYAELGMLPADTSLNGFLYSPNPQPNFRLVGFIIGAVTTILIISFVALRFFRLNKKLDKLLYIRNQHANLGESLDNISHQWKQPLNELGVHMMLIETMLQQYSVENSRGEIQKILTKSHNILGFMAETIDMFRHFVSSSRKISRFDPAIMINETLQLVSENFKMEAIVMVHDVEVGLYVIGNATEFSHVLLSLLVNAKDTFSERGASNPQIRIRLFQKQRSVILTIADNAGGILIKPIKRIFNAGVSGKKHPESGLGLYISKKIIEEKMGGTIQAENYDQGALFRISLPLAESIASSQKIS